MGTKMIIRRQTGWEGNRLRKEDRSHNESNTHNPEAKMHQARIGLRKLFSFLGPWKKRYFTGLFSQNVIWAVDRLATGIILMYLTNAVFEKNASLLINTSIFAITFTVAVVALVRYPRYLWISAVYSGMAHLRERVFNHILSLPAAYFESHHTGNAVSVLTNDVTATEEAYRQNMMNLTNSLLEGVVCSIAMFVVDWRMASLSFGCCAAAFVVTTLFAKPLRRIGQNAQEKLGVMSERYADLIAGFQVVRAFSMGKWVLERFEHSNAESKKTALRRVALESGMAFINSFWMLSSVIQMAFGVYLVSIGETDMGSMVAIIQFTGTLQFSVQRLGGTISRIQSAFAGADRIQAVFDTAAEPEHYGEGALAVDATQLACAPAGETAVSFNQVCFAYDEATGERILKDLSFVVKPGQVVALAGPSGGGKSTILKLLQGFYPPGSGAICVLGKPLTSYRLDDLRRQFAFVPQEAYLFATTIEENIAYGRPGASHEEIVAAAKAANAHEFIMETPDGYQTLVGERGVRLSGGQKQRIAIARALLKDAPILLLDEATSSLDTESELLVQRALEHLMAGRTTLVVAHRLATIQKADCIMTIADGTVAEQGTHEELVAKGGIYADLVAAGQAALAS